MVWRAERTRWRRLARAASIMLTSMRCWPGLPPLLHAPATVLVKGSRFMRMERVSAALLGQAPAAAH